MHAFQHVSGALLLLLGCWSCSDGSLVDLRDAALDPADSSSNTEPSGDAGSMSNDLTEDAAAIGNCSEVVATVRDFDVAHEDFENSDQDAVVAGLIESELGSDGLPVFAHGEETVGAIHGQAGFDQWYRDVPGTNEAFEVMLPITQVAPGRFVYDTSAFFPVDDRGFGNSAVDREGQMRNFHFTTHITTSFTYSPGQTFTFRGDDDLWMFVDNQLVIDLGGTHQAAEQTVNMDTLGLTEGETYSMDIFHAERHTIESNFRIETSIECFMDPILR